MKQTDLSATGSPAIPGLSEGESEPYFHAPWQAKLFALTTSLQQNGLFDWSEWTERLSERLKTAADLPSSHSTPDHAAHYYAMWLHTLEDILARAGAAQTAQIDDVAAHWKRAARATPHGSPILYENGRDDHLH